MFHIIIIHCNQGFFVVPELIHEETHFEMREVMTDAPEGEDSRFALAKREMRFKGSKS